jgi:hypothetical protein
MENLNTIFLVIATLILAAIVSVVLKPKSKGPKVDTKAFESLIDDEGWAEEEESAKPAARPNAVPTVMPSAVPTSQESAQPIKKKVNDGPFKIGDRVILKNLVSSKEINGRHGIIANLWDKKTERYPVDLDLVDHKREKPLSVKVGNMDREPAIEANCEKNRVIVSNGCLEESQGRIASFIFSALKSSVANSFKEIKDPQKLTNFGWRFWKTPDGNGVYPGLKQFLTKGILTQNKLEDLDKQLNPQNPKGAYLKVTEAMSSEQAVASWNVRVEGAFWIVGMGPEGTLVCPVKNPRQVYCVVGFKKPLGAQGQFPRPPKFFLTLVPWYGRIIHDPMLVTSTGTNQVELAPPPLAAKLVANCKLAAEEGRVVARLAQLEVPGGSKVGLPRVEMVPTPVKLPPATEEERLLVENVCDFESMPAKQPASAWNFIRHAVAEENNPQHKVVIINGKGEKLGEFDCKAPVPTATEVLKALVTVCKERKQRPRMIGLEESSSCMRVQFLMQGVKDVMVAQLRVNRKPQAGRPAQQ